MQKFSEINPGIFRAINGLCYSKIIGVAQTCGEDSKEFNAVSISQGALRLFKDDEEVEQL